MVVPCITIRELTDGIHLTKNEAGKKVLIGILNDYMDLLYSKSTPYTTGKTVIPSETTIEDVDAAAADSGTDKKYIAMFKKISETYKSGDLTPQSKNGENGISWDPKLSPVLVMVKPNP